MSRLWSESLVSVSSLVSDQSQSLRVSSHISVIGHTSRIDLTLLNSVLPNISNLIHEDGVVGGAVD